MPEKHRWKTRMQKNGVTYCALPFGVYRITKHQDLKTIVGLITSILRLLYLIKIESLR